MSNSASSQNLWSVHKLNSARTGMTLIAAALSISSPNTPIRGGHFLQNTKWMEADDFPQETCWFYSPPISQTSALKRAAIRTKDTELETIFNGLAQNWIEATRSYSLNMRRYAHPTYQALMHTLGKEDVKDVVPLILRELQQRPDVWFEALKVLTKHNPAREAKSFDETVRAWLEWGKAEKYIF